MSGLPRGLRDTRSFYREADAREQVDPAILDWVAAHAGREVLDLGCGLGGYALALAERGFAVRGLDVQADYVERARALGVRADLYDGEGIPLGDRAVDTVMLVEVLEHVEDPAALLREARRVARRGVLVTTPNGTQDFAPAPVEFSHVLDVDHRRLYTAASLTALLDEVFGSSAVEQVAPVDGLLAGLVLPRGLRRLYALLADRGLIRPRFHFRLRGRAPAP